MARIKSDYVIREVDGTRHGDLLLKMQAECFPSDSKSPPYRGYWWIAYKAGVPAAFAALRDVKREESVGYLDRAGVLWSHRGQGLQSRLIRARLRKAQQLGWQTVITSTHDNPASGNNLIRCGFRMYTPKSPWMAPGTAYWRRTLGDQ